MAKMDLISLMTYRPDPANDPNDAYAVIPTPAELRGPPTDWWIVTPRTEADLLLSAPATQQKHSARPAVGSSLRLNVS